VKRPLVCENYKFRLLHAVNKNIILCIVLFHCTMFSPPATVTMEPTQGAVDKIKRKRSRVARAVSSLDQKKGSL
jgi:hypothetical protein